MDFREFLRQELERDPEFRREWEADEPARKVAHAVIGARCRLFPGVVIGRNCRLGDDVSLHPNVVLYDRVVLGHRVAIHASAVIGADGFGYRVQDGRHVKVPQLGSPQLVYPPNTQPSGGGGGTSTTGGAAGGSGA